MLPGRVPGPDPSRVWVPGRGRARRLHPSRGTAEARRMLFCSREFLVFFFVVFAVYWAVPWPRVRVWLLLVASFYFYASWNLSLACLIFVSTILDYCLARGIEGLK